MFEQAFVDHVGRTNRPWTVVVSAAGQSIVVAGVILFTLARTDALPRNFGHVGLPLVAPGPVKAVSTPAPQRSAILDERPPLLPFPLMQPRRTGPVATISDGEAPQIGSGVGIPGLEELAVGTCIGCSGTPPVVAPRPAIAAQPVDRKPVVAASTKPLAVGGDVQSAKLIHQVKPAYPPLASSARVSGTVRIEAIISREGTIQNLRLLSGHPLLSRAALEAVAQWRYQPTLLNGQPVEVITLIEVNFTLAR